jgi:hypothetical protein
MQELVMKFYVVAWTHGRNIPEDLENFVNLRVSRK